MSANTAPLLSSWESSAVKPNDVYVWKGIRASRFALIAQGEFYDFLDTVIVIPLVPESALAGFDIINPAIEVQYKPYLARTELMTAVARSTLGKFVQSANTHSVEIARAIDRLMTGF
jgi:hypothetical protein